MSLFVNLKNTPKFYTQTSNIINFLNDIRKFNTLSVDEEKETLKAIKNGDIDARNKLIECNQRFIFSVAKRYATNETNLMDIINEANIGLIKAIDNYNESFNTRFITYAIWFITREVNQYLNNTEDMVQKSNIQKTKKRITKIKNSFFLKNGYYPSTNEIIDELKEKYQIDIIDKRDVYDLTMLSIDSTLNGDDDSINIDSTYEYVNKTSSDNHYDNITNNDFNKTLVNDLIETLDEREQLVIKLAFGIDYDKPYELNEIADITNLTSERVRQIKVDVLSKFKYMIEHHRIAI